MPLSDTASIDLITLPLPGDTCALVLYIVDSELSENEDRRYVLFFEKLITYVGYVSTREFKLKYQNVLPKNVLIRVLTINVPNDSMRLVTEAGPPNGAWMMKVVFDDYQEFVQRMGSN